MSMSTNIQANDNHQYGERFSFFTLFKKKGYRISIPIIQRDYAQGRATTEEVRTNFLNALYEYLDKNIPNRDLDFIYGSLSDSENETVFIPLDGQQRLTTLFLLHWYLYQISSNEDIKTNYIKNLVKDGKSMFTYETRTSSSEFCDALMNSVINFENLIENSLSKTIINSSWFYLSWKNDPTIQSMLVMLDTIHKLFYGRQYFFERLLDEENPIITFLFLNLDDFQLTDDLYIKMNSRGKPLTSFENFKAKYEQSLDCVDVKDRIFNLDFAGTSKIVSLKKYFSFNIDTKWANLFWKYRTIIDKNAFTFDKILENFIRVIFTAQYMLTAYDDVLYKSNYENIFDACSNLLKDNTKNISYHLYRVLDVVFDEEIKAKHSKEPGNEKYISVLESISSGCALSVIDALDCYSNGNNTINHHIADKYKYYYDEEIVFKNALKNDFVNNHQRICFYAYTRFLIVNKGDYSGINEWMRVVHNLSHPENTIIDDNKSIANALKSIENMLECSNDIISYLCKNPNISFFSSWQVKEEIVKAHLIAKNEKWGEFIRQAEQHRYFNGQICFLLEFAGILKYYNENKNCNWNEEEDEKHFSDFNNYRIKASLVFANSYDDRIDMKKDYAFERAVLTKGDYLMTTSSNRKNMLSSNVISNNIKRDFSWKRFLRYNDDNNFKIKRNYVKQVFDDSRIDVNDIWNSLELISKDVTSSWRDYLISCPQCIAYCKQGFIRFDNGEIILLGQSQMNHLHVELRTYFLYNMNVIKCTPFKKAEYEAVKSIEDSPYLQYWYCYKPHGLDGYCDMYIDIYYYNNKYTIEFWFSNRGIKDIEPCIDSIMKKHKFDNKSYYYQKVVGNDDNELIAIVENLCKNVGKLKTSNEFMYYE